MSQPAPEQYHQIECQIDPARANALQSTLGRTERIATGDALPPFYHQLYFWDPQPSEALGRDGHPRVGGLVPDTGLPRRMWAGGRLQFHAPLLAGVAAKRVSRCHSVTRKDGRTGPLAFVTLQHHIVQAGMTCITEFQDLVYRADPAPGAPRPVPPRAPDTPATARRVTFDSTLLFRYSALTFNGHRIHYDESYARAVEGYGGLVVHGPLLAQLLMLMAEEYGALTAFEFRGTAPLMHTEAALLCNDGGRMWVAKEDGRQVMQAQATC